MTPVIPPAINHKLCIAPMMAHTDRHFRYLLRLISPHVMLYTEMITTGALIHGNSRKLLAFDPFEHPLAIQLGGSEPEFLSRCSGMAEAAGYDEVNFNLGCPSERVQNARYGACLMALPDLAAACVAAMKEATRLPVSVKIRTGVDDLDSEDFLFNFIDRIAAAGCRTFIIHARKAWLQGLSPRQNRNIPPLHYELVYRVKEKFPELEIIINGGFYNMETIGKQYRYVDGVMIGRMVCNDPYRLIDANKIIFSDTAPSPSRHELMHAFIPYMEKQLATGTDFRHMSRHILGLFQGIRGARAYRRYLSENMKRTDCWNEIIREALNMVQPANPHVT